MAPHGKGRRVVQKKFKREKKTGRYVGAPDWVGASSQKLGGLTRKLKRLAREGTAGKYWYEGSSQAILDFVGGDKIEAEKIVGLIAIYSPNATVPANTTMALTAYYQWKANGEINAGFGAADRKAENLLGKGEYWEGIKTNSFYQNLMVEIDASKLDPGVATMDMWMALAADYGMKVLDQGPKYKFMETMTYNISQDLGWEPHQVQAAIWTATKGRVDPIRPKLKKQELKKGIGKVVTKTVDGKQKEVYEIQDLKAHYHLAHKLGMAYDLKQEDIDASKYDFSNALKASGIMLSWEATPGKSTGVLPGIHTATTAQKMEYLTAIQKVLAPEGKDLIAEAVGIPQGETLFGFSAWEGDIGAGAQTLTAAPMGDMLNLDEEGKPLKPKKLRGPKAEARELLNLYSAAKGYVLSQEAVVWHTPVYDKVQSRNNGAELDIGRPFTEDEFLELYQALHDEFDTWDIAPGYTATGARLLNFNPKLGNVDFHKRLVEVLKGLPMEHIRHRWFRSSGDYIFNDWQENPNGEGYQRTITTGSPALQGRVADLRASVAAVNKEFEDLYGWAQEDLAPLTSLEQGVGDNYVAGTDLDPFLERLNSSEDAKELLVKVIADNEDKMWNARRGKMTVDEMQQRAVELGWTERDMKELKRGSGVNPEEFEAGRVITDAALTRLQNLAETARNGSDADVIAFDAALKRFTPLAETMLGMRAEWGRVGVMMQQQAMQHRQINAILEGIGGSDVAKGKAAVIADLVDRGASGADISRMARKIAETRNVDMFMEAWFAFLLSGLRTHAVNSTSNMLVAMWTIPEHLTAAMLGKVFSGSDRVYFREVQARSIGMVAGMRDGMSLAKEIVREDMPMGQWIAQNLDKVLGLTPAYIAANADVLMDKLGQKIEGQPRVKHIPGQLGVWVRSPLTMLSVEDAVFQMTGYRMELYAQGARQAIREGVPNVNERMQEIANEVDELIGRARPKEKDMTSEEEIIWKIFDDSWAQGKYQTFTNELGPAGHELNKWINKNLDRWPIAVRLAIPFVRTPTNIVKFFGHRTPLAPMMPSWREMYNKGGAYRNIAVARMLFGSAVMVTAYTLALAGKITGGGPSDDERNERRIWRQKYSPYSGKIGDKYYAFNRLEPLGMLFGVAGDMAYLNTRFGVDDAGDLFQLVHSSIMHNLLSKTWMTGLSEAINVFYEPTRYGERVFGRLFATAVPTIVSHVAKLNDPYMREVNSLLDAFRAKIPGLRDTLEIRHNMWGTPITYGGILGPDMISFIYMGEDPKDPVIDELIRLEHFPGMPGKKINGVELTPAQYNEFLRVRGIPAKEELDGLVENPMYKQLSDWRRIERIDKVMRRSTERARKEMSRRYPDIPSDMEAGFAVREEHYLQDMEMR